MFAGSVKPRPRGVCSGMKFGQTLKARVRVGESPALARARVQGSEEGHQATTISPFAAKWVETLDPRSPPRRASAARAPSAARHVAPHAQPNKVRRVPSRVTQDAAAPRTGRGSTIALRKIVKKFDKAHRAGDDDGARRGAGATGRRAARRRATASSALTELRARCSTPRRRCSPPATATRTARTPPAAPRRARRRTCSSGPASTPCTAAHARVRARVPASRACARPRRRGPGSARCAARPRSRPPLRRRRRARCFTRCPARYDERRNGRSRGAATSRLYSRPSTTRARRVSPGFRDTITLPFFSYRRCSSHFPDVGCGRL